MTTKTSSSTPEIHIVILAGGVGTRFWPMSRTNRPKQFLSINPDGESLIQWTVRRIRPLLGDAIQHRLWVVTNEQQAELVHQHVPDAQILKEPVGKNTAASIMLAAARIHKRSPHSIMVVLPADHAVANDILLRETISKAVRIAAEKPFLVTVGIPPTAPNTAYGYIQVGKELGEDGFVVNRFYEKPNNERAKQYFESGAYLWNSGMFVWHVDVLLAAFAEHAPHLAAGAAAVESALDTPHAQVTLEQVFSSLESISIDFAVLEHARNCAVIRASNFGWNDVGSWDSWADLYKRDALGNMAQGDVLLLDAKGCIVLSHDRPITLVGTEDIVVIDSGDALLVVPRDKTQDVKKVVDELRKQQRMNLV